MSPEQFVAACKPFQNVSHETVSRLQTYADLLVKWQKTINLVSPSTLDHIWQRHFFDSAQLLAYINPAAKVVDFGSGAGFPALVLAIMGVAGVTVIESDQRKVAFLREVSRATQTPMTFLNKRIEEVDAFAADVLTARALASVDQLLAYSAPWLALGAKAIWLKGENVKEELTAASAKWHIRAELKSSLADPAGAVLMIDKVDPQA